MRRGAIILLALLGAVWMAAQAGEQDLRAMYQDALKVFYAGDYDRAESLFATVYRNAPRARFASDAVFKAGECAFRTERYDAAALHFEHYLREYPVAGGGSEAKERLRQAREKRPADHALLPLPDVKREWPRLAAAWPANLPVDDAAAVNRALRGLQASGYNTVVVSAYKQLDDPPLLPGGKPCVTGAYFTTEAAPVCAEIIEKLVVAAHRVNMRLIAVLPVRGAVRPDEPHADRRWDTFTQAVVADAHHVDLWRDPVAKRLVQLAKDLALRGPDGIWLDLDSGFRPDEGLSDGALAATAAQLGRDFDPAAVFQKAPLGPGGRIRGGIVDEAFGAFCEARAARLAETTNAMLQAVGEMHPSCRRGLMAPLAAASEPVAGMRDAALDFDALPGGKTADLVARFNYRGWKLRAGFGKRRAHVALDELAKGFDRAVKKSEHGVVVLDVSSPAGKTMPAWEIREVLARLTAAEAYGVVLAPPARDETIDKILEPSR
ncbi:MAG: hypothetical protein P9L99_17425 [Candidatus Lernaella stagnicola]|nr:hypothetical protein [Candidatus Lernaella stagnicola]